MPHITFPLADLRTLAGLPDLSLEQVEEVALLVKGELKLRHSSEEEVKVELQDTNRPDTWCVEGIARQARQHQSGQPGDYGFFESPGEVAGAIEVDASVQGVRPFVAGFLAEGYAVDDAGLKAFISTQEVLCRNFGRMRKSVAIGIYDASAMQFPISYAALAADDPKAAFRPLPPAGDGEVHGGDGEPLSADAFEEDWTPARILKDHPTGREYAAALKNPAQAPLLRDAGGQVLSFPPIINSAGLGRVTEGMSELFVEVTGDVLDQVLLAINILAANLADRGATIRAVTTRYPFETPRGKEVIAPHPLPDRRTVEVDPARFGALLGEPELRPAAIVERLRHFGLQVEEPSGSDRLQVTTLPYRADYLHAVDAIEDFAISRGYESFTPRMPEEFTVGGIAPATAFADTLRDRAVGCGFEEAIGNLLTSEERVRGRMGIGEADDGWAPLHGGKLVRIQNVMNLNYAVLRDWLLPTLLEIESSSTGANYPHRFFESGEVCVWDAGENLRSRTERRLAGLIAADEVSFSDIQARLHLILVNLGFNDPNADVAYTLEPVEHPCFIPGRCAWVVVNGVKAGLLGEVHPAVLDRWGVRFPCGAFELRQSVLRTALGR